jgi:hypothetical protein
MEFLILWVYITLAVGFLKLNNFQYILFSLIMLCITYIYNKISPVTMSLRHAILLSIIPNSCLWYLAYKCNDFLWIYPYDSNLFIAIFLVYSYILIYIACEC